MADIGGLFSSESERYDTTVQWVAPYYKVMHNMLLQLAGEVVASQDMGRGAPMVGLDLGSGSGAEAVALMNTIPNLSLVGVDDSHDMHKIFLERAAAANVDATRFRLLEMDILDPHLKDHTTAAAAEYGVTGFHVAVSGFTLHHFTTQQKASVFDLVYELLQPGGAFLLGDLFNYDQESEWLSRTISSMENRWMAKNFTQAVKQQTDNGNESAVRGLSALREKWLRHYQEENHMDSVACHAKLLRKAGFREVGNPFRYWQVGLILAFK